MFCLHLPYCYLLSRTATEFVKFYFVLGFVVLLPSEFVFSESFNTYFVLELVVFLPSESDFY